MVRNLLEKLDRFENLLTDYAYEELTSSAAVDLKNKFQVFKTDLQHKVFDESAFEDNSCNMNNINSDLQLPKKVFKNASNTVELLKSLKKTGASKSQEEIIQNIVINNLILIEMSMGLLKNQINNNGKV